MKEYLINRNDTLAFPVPNMHIGMTLRDYFAAKSITWFLSALENEGLEDPALLRQFAAESAYRMADAMMKAREA